MERPQVSQELSRARRHFERWRRRAGGRGSRIPADLWGEAAGAAREAGVWATARALHLNYERLKKVVGGRRAGRREEERVPSFIDLGPGALGGGGKTVLEVARRDGERLRIDVDDSSRVDVVALARALWGERP